jgi:hypothetical protein
MTQGTRLSEDWNPNGEQRDYARQQGVADVNRMTEDFKDYWLSAAGAKARKADWNRTWKKWARTEGDRQREKAAREQRVAKPSPSYRSNLASAQADIEDMLFGNDHDEDRPYLRH